MLPGCVVWLTGLPSSGKSTLARLLEAELRRLGRPVELLDGDEVRTRLTRGLGFSREDRDENVRRVAYVARLLQRHGVIVITALISPYRGTRDEVRAEIKDFVEGLTDPYEAPLDAGVTAETDRETHAESLAKIVRGLRAFGYLADEAPAERRG
jgi:adenylylsulfate kinase-like enzyme